MTIISCLSLILVLVLTANTLSLPTASKSTTRILQDLDDITSACQVARQALLLDDDDLNAVAVNYYNHWGNATTLIDFKDSSVCDNNTSSDLINCVVPNNVSGTKEFQTACESESGTFYPASMDFRCDIYLPGDQDMTRANIDLPPYYVCIPKECQIKMFQEEIYNVQQRFVMFYDDLFDYKFGLTGHANGGADCKAHSGIQTMDFLYSLVLGGLGCMLFL